jgi:hypothetical protein
MKDINDTTTEIRNMLDLESFNYISPSTTKPELTSDDYDDEFITRYFFSNINYNNTKETDVNSFNSLDVSFFKKKSIKWKLTGSNRNVYENNILKFEGVYESNLKKINELEQTFGDIKSILTNPLEFWRGY